MEEHFAALRIPDSEPNNGLTRAISYPNLRRSNRQFYTDQSCSASNDAIRLVARYNYEQTFDRSTEIRKVIFTNILQASYADDVKSWRSIVPFQTAPPTDRVRVNDDGGSPPRSRNDQVEYMEVEDLNTTNRFVAPIALTNKSALNARESSPLKAIDNSAVPIVDEMAPGKIGSSHAVKNEDTRATNYQDMKDKIRPLVPKHTMKTKAKACSCSCFQLLFLILLPISLLLISLFLYQDEDRERSNDFVDVIGELKKRIHGQDRAVEALSEYLQLKAPSLKVIALVGGTGVGKSYTVEMIKRNFPKAHTVHQYFPPIKITINDIDLSFLYPNLVVLENLKEHHVMDVVDFLETRQNVRDNRHVTVLAVFNVEQLSRSLTRSINLDRSIEVMKSSFVDKNIDAKIIRYDPLSEDSLERCIKDVARDCNLMLSVNQIESIKEILLTNNAGCKGAYSKVQVIGRQ